MHDDRDLDALLDEALNTYSHVEPDPSLRTRITARANDAASRRFWPWTCATASAAAALALALFLLHPQSARPPGHDAANIVPAAPVAPSGTSLQRPLAVERTHALRTARHIRHLQSAAIEHSRYKASDDILTEEDRVLLQFVADHPLEARQALTPPPQQPVEIKPITIAPIQIADMSEFTRPTGSNPRFEK